jgi:CRP/FNR family transcriptional regulator, cyclic AMP receptor protein
MPETRIQSLQRMPIFGGMRGDVLEFLLDTAAVTTADQGKFFFHEHDKAQSMFVLEAGEVAVLKLWEGQQCLLGHLRQGDCFGEMALMDLGPRSASVMAVKDCRAIELSTASFYKIYEKNLEQFALLQMNIGREVSRRLRDADERLFRAHMGAAELEPELLIPYT